MTQLVDGSQLMISHPVAGTIDTYSTSHVAGMKAMKAMGSTCPFPLTKADLATVKI